MLSLRVSFDKWDDNITAYIRLKYRRDECCVLNNKSALQKAAALWRKRSRHSRTIWDELQSKLVVYGFQLSLRTRRSNIWLNLLQNNCTFRYFQDPPTTENVHRKNINELKCKDWNMRWPMSPNYASRVWLNKNFRLKRSSWKRYFRCQTLQCHLRGSLEVSGWRWINSDFILGESGLEVRM